MLEYNVILYFTEGEEESVMTIRVEALNEETAAAKAVFSLTTSALRGIDEIVDVEVYQLPEN